MNIETDSFASSINLSASSLSAAYLNSIRPGIEQHYAMDLSQILKQSGLTQQQLDDPHYMVPFSKVGALFMLLMQQTGDAGLGLLVGSLVQPRSYQVLGYAVMSSATLGEAIDRLIRYEKLVGKLGSTEFSRQDEVCRLSWRCPFQGPWTAFLEDAAIAGWVTFGRQLLTERVNIKRVCFYHGPQAGVERYQSIFHSEVLFQQDWCGVEFDAALLLSPISSADPGLKAMMDAQAETLLRDFEQKANLHNEVRALVTQLLPGGEPTLDVVAEHLKIPDRTLQNRLREGGTPFKEFVDGIRKTLVVNYLRDESFTLLDIAFLLGFSEQSSFSRAFKRWYGQAPQSYRKQLLAD